MNKTKFLAYFTGLLALVAADLTLAAGSMRLRAGGVTIANNSTINCGLAKVGQTVNCPEITFTWEDNSSNYERWRNSEVYTLAPVTHFQKNFTSSDCVLNTYYYGGTIVCRAKIRFKPTASGTHTATVTLKGLTWPYSGAGRTLTYTVYVQGSTPPANEWEVGEFGACEGGTGGWEVSAWAPAEGCGLIEQGRTAICSTVADSGVQSRPVVCKTPAGDVVDDAECEGDKPATTQACTPAPAICGAQPETSRFIELMNGCPPGCQPDPENGKYCLKMPL